ncbi:MAG: adenosine deaminase, partial [Longimicrobiaceae bacterium]
MTIRTPARRLATLALALLPALARPAPARAQAAAGREAAAAAALERLRGAPPRLYAFLRAMPKGGALHSHLSGAV